MIKINNAEFRYGDSLVFSDLSISLKQGEVLCLMGPNGCGKSTLIDCVLGTKRLYKGEILLQGKSIRGYSAKEVAKQIAYIPQYHEQAFEYKVEQVVLMGCSPKGALSLFSSPGDEEMEVVFDALETVGITHLAGRAYTQLSGGEIQLVLLARALAQQTPILALDEPTAYLDLHNELLFLETVKDLVIKTGKTLLIATHSPNHGFYFDKHGIETKIGLMVDNGLYSWEKPIDVLTHESIDRVYNVKAEIVTGELEELHQVISHGTIKR